MEIISLKLAAAEAERSVKKIMKDVLSEIKPEEALVILRYLAKSDSNIKEKILSIAEDIVKDVDVEAICDDVFFVLDGIDVHELWNRAGQTSDGYASPEEMAFEMIEEELEPFNQDVIRLCELNLSEESKLFCMGVLKGIYKYDQESQSEFKDWAVDVPGECFGYLLDEWKKRCKNEEDIREMDIFLEKGCSGWAK
ncbi:MAG: hypothetical protein HGJ94_00705 [Desulfosarcina sp.]|nr:hypothetical protein [Desulfosarcina sp.]